MWRRVAPSALGLAISLVLTVWVLGITSPAVQAQQLGVPQSDILTISSERLFSDSAFGRRIAREIAAESRILAAENRRIEAELTAEEKDLTVQRPDMEPAAFRVLADAFDEKVQSNRAVQDAKARTLAQKGDAARVDFLQAAQPVLALLMRETGASIVLERSSVFLSADATDITDLAIARIDAAIGEGAAMSAPAE